MDRRIVSKIVNFCLMVMVGLVLLFFILPMVGCSASPRPAKTEIKPGSSELSVERIENRPSESTIKVKMHPKPEPTVRILIKNKENN
jgi:hypothetical protein